MLGRLRQEDAEGPEVPAGVGHQAPHGGSHAGFRDAVHGGGQFVLHSNPLHPGEEQQTMLSTHWDKARVSRVAEQGGDGQAQDFAPILRQLIYIRDGVLKEILRNVAIETINQV